MKNTPIFSRFKVMKKGSSYSIYDTLVMKHLRFFEYRCEAESYELILNSLNSTKPYLASEISLNY